MNIQDQTVPPGFRKAEVLLTDVEYEKLRQQASLISGGTISEVIRYRLGMTYQPYGINVARKRLQEQITDQQARKAGG